MMLPPEMKEFEGAPELEKAHRYGVVTHQRSFTAFFGLLGTDGVLRRFQVDGPRLPAIAHELTNLVHMGKWAMRGGDPKAYYPTHMPGPLPRSSDGLIAPYVGPVMKLRRAFNLYYELEDVQLSYSRRVKVVPEFVSADITNTTWRIKFSESPPGVISLLIGDIAHNLRSALDVLVCDLARINNGSTDQLKFPFAASEAELTKLVARDLRKAIGDSASDDLISLQPYKGGDLSLRGLHDLNIIDKHRLVVPTFCAAWHRHDFAQRVADQINREDPNGEPLKIAFFDMDGIVTNAPLIEGSLFVCPTGEEPLRYYTQVEHGIEARFSGPVKDLAFADKPVLETLGRLLDLTEQIILGFQERYPAPAAAI